MSTQEGTSRQIVTSIRLSREEHSFLKDLAESQRRSISDQLRYMLDLAREEREAA